MIARPMRIETLGEAWKFGWRVRVRCLLAAENPHSRNRRYTIECNPTADLDMKTLVWTRGEGFPPAQLASRLKCPRCGNRNVTVVFDVPDQPSARARTP
jgi:hypothetical protein